MGKQMREDIVQVHAGVVNIRRAVKLGKAMLVRPPKKACVCQGTSGGEVAAVLPDPWLLGDSLVDGADVLA